MEAFKDFFVWKFGLAANHQYPESIQIRFRLQNCLNRKSSISLKYSKTFRSATSSNQQYPSRNQQSSSNLQQLASRLRSTAESTTVGSFSFSLLADLLTFFLLFLMFYLNLAYEFSDPQDFLFAYSLWIEIWVLLRTQLYGCTFCFSVFC